MHRSYATCQVYGRKLGKVVVDRLLCFLDSHSVAGCRQHVVARMVRTCAVHLLSAVLTLCN